MKRIVVVNQAANYLTIGISNELTNEYDQVVLITGSIHDQGEKLNPKVKVSKINKYSDGNIRQRILNWSTASVWVFFLILIKYRKFEILYITNPPSAYLASLLLPNKFSILMWDVYPDLLKIYNISNENILYRFWSLLNRVLFKRVFKIYSIGEKSAQLINHYVETKKVLVCNLWSNFNNMSFPLFEENEFIKNNNLGNKFVIQYSGNIGTTHNLDALINLAQYLRKERDILIQIIGRGNRKTYYEKIVSEKKLTNIQFLPFQSDNMFPSSISAAHVGVVVLDNRVSKGSVPSKTYNLMSAGKPIMYIASSNSELSIYAKKYKNGKCFNSTSIDEISKFVIKLKNDKQYYQLLSTNSQNAASYFTRKNARVFVENHLDIHGL